jgi:hypothetical protein
MLVVVFRCFAKLDLAIHLRWILIPGHRLMWVIPAA